MSQSGRTRLQTTASANEDNECVELNAATFAPLRACACVAADGHLCNEDHQYLREFSLLAANSASSAHKSAHVVSHSDELLVLKCVIGDDDAKGKQECKANKKVASMLLDQHVCGGFVAPEAHIHKTQDRRAARWFLFRFAGVSLQFINSLIPLFQEATIGHVRAAKHEVSLLRVRRTELPFEDAMTAINLNHPGSKDLSGRKDNGSEVVSIEERDEIVDVLCDMPELASARTFVRSAFNVARALASDERVMLGALLQIVYSLSCAEQRLKLVHKDLHAKNVCLQPLDVWQVLFDDDQVAYFIAPGVRCCVIDFGVSEFDSTAHLVCTEAVAKLLVSMSLLYDLTKSRLRADNMASLWAKMTALDDFAALGKSWRVERPADFVVEGALFFSRDAAAFESRRNHLTDLCRTECAWSDLVATARGIMAGHTLFHFRGASRLDQLQSANAAASAAVVDCWLVRIVDDDGRRLRALGWLVAVPGDEPVVVVSSERSLDIVSCWRVLARELADDDGDVCAHCRQTGLWLSEFRSIDAIRSAFACAHARVSAFVI